MRRCATLTVLAVGLLLAIAPAMCLADFIDGASGNTRAANIVDRGIDGTFSFTVVNLFQNDGVRSAIEGFTFIAGSGSPVLDLGAHYLYLYQAVNDGTNLTTIDDVTITLGGAQTTDLTSWGYFDSVSLKDAQGVVGQSVGLLGGRLNAFGDIDNAAYGTGVAPANIGVSAPGFDTSGLNMQAPFRVKPVDQGAVDTLKAYFDPIFNNSGAPIPPGTPFRSPIFGFTTNIAPTFGTVNFQDGGGQAIGTVPAAVPEPATWLALLGALPLVAWVTRRRLAR